MTRFVNSKCVNILLGLMLVLVGAGLALAEGPSAEELAKANNPLADLTAFNLQNYHASSLYGVPDETANTFWLRGAKPTGKILWRASLPIKTVPHPGGDINGIGDFELFGAYLLKNSPKGTFGIGPQVSFNTADRMELGTGKTQLGVAAVAFAVVSPTFQTGGLLFWQTSIGGDEDREDTSTLAVQPFSFWQLGGGTYLRTAPIAAFNLRSGDYIVPFGFGVGKVVKAGTTNFNIFIEPQWTILYKGTGVPKFQLYTAVNMQFF